MITRLSKLTLLFALAALPGLDGSVSAAAIEPHGGFGVISGDGQWLAYTPRNRDFRTWKRYRGGLAADVWLFHLTEHTSKKITDWEGTDTLPMWQGKQVYYLSDAGPAHRLNIWRYDLETETRAQVTHFKAYDVKWPSNGPGTQGQGEIIFENNGRLYLLNLVQSRHLSPQAKRVLVQARGDVWSLSAQEGTPRNLTRPARMNWSCGPQTGAVRP